MIEIDLIRHVKVEGKSALYGCTDVASIASENARLLEQLVNQQRTNKAYQSIVCSPLIRCQQLAKEFSRRCELPLETSKDLQEMNFGRFDGVAFDELLFKDPVPVNEVKQEQIHQSEAKAKLHWSQLDAFFQAPAQHVLPEAETLFDFHHRVTIAWQQLIEQQITKKEPPKRIVVIAHGGVIRIILAHILQLDWQQPSWYQKLQISHGSLSRVVISQPYQNRQQPLFQQQLHQQVTTIAMPFLKEL